MYRVKNLILIIFFNYILVFSALAGGPGTSGAEILKENLGARPLALGGAFSTISNDIHSLLFNPAGLGTLVSKQTVAQHYMALAKTNYELIGYAQPLAKQGGLAGIVIWKNMPAIDHAEATDSKVEANDFILNLGWGYKLKALSDIWPDNLYLGLGGKLIYLNLRESSAISVAGDFGITWTSPTKFILPLTLGIALQNIGLPIKFIDYSDPLPITARLGLKYTPYSSPKHSLLILSEAIFRQDIPFELGLGVEYLFNKSIFLRLGYRLNESEKLNSLSVGTGLNILIFKVDLKLDYTYCPIIWQQWKNISNHHLFSLGVNF